MKPTKPSKVTPYGFCHCGCGERTNLVPNNITRTGQKKGEPYKYIRGHQTRITAEVIEVDCGYTTPCWMLDLDKNQNYYIRLERDGKRQMWHRRYYEDKFGPIPEGLLPHHKCENKSCFNPGHIELVTNAVNVQLGKRTKLTRQDADEIREIGRLWRIKGKSGYIRELADKFCVSRTTIERVINGQTWKTEETY